VTGDTLDDRFAARLGALLGPDFPPVLGLAVSGGADSMAMLALAHGWARPMGVRLRVATVDHGLRDGSADEAARVAAECAALGHPHDTLNWTWDGQGNLQDAARRARLALIGRWAEGAPVLFAHTRDDLAETLLMRLRRGSGVDGLAAMAERQRVGQGAAAFWQLRPLLGERRADLRHYADTLHLPYVDDPSNDDPRFERARTRAAIAALDLDVEGLARTAERLSRARVALEARVDAVAGRIAVEGRALGHPTGIAEIDRDGLAAVERETQLRLLARAVAWVTGDGYRPRAATLEDALDRALGGGGTTLQGAQILVGRERLLVLREPAAVGGPVPLRPGAIWDMRWRIDGPASAGHEVRALGEAGWRQIGEKPPGTPPFAAALSLPAVFDGERLVAALHFGFGPACGIALMPDRGPLVAGSKAH
jgi:tRNA(Ile)-lysidine synthase